MAHVHLAKPLYAVLFDSLVCRLYRLAACYICCFETDWCMLAVQNRLHILNSMAKNNIYMMYSKSDIFRKFL